MASRKPHSGAQFFRKQARRLTKNQANARAVGGREWLFDLHGLHVPEAEKFVSEKLSSWLSGGLGKHYKLVFICGKGSHSAGGQAKLLPALEKLLRNSYHELILEVGTATIAVSKPGNDLTILASNLRQLTKLGADANARAVGGRKWLFDLHGLLVPEAEKIVSEMINAWFSGAGGLGKHSKFVFICGKGAHSAGGQAKLLPALEKLLKNSYPELILKVGAAAIVVSKACNDLTRQQTTKEQTKSVL